MSRNAACQSRQVLSAWHPVRRAMFPAVPALRRAHCARGDGTAGAQVPEGAGHRDVEAQDAALPALPVNYVKEKSEQPRKDADNYPPVSNLHNNGAIGELGKLLKAPKDHQEKQKEKKHPFVLYGCGEKTRSIGSQKPHTCASAPAQISFMSQEQKTGGKNEICCSKVTCFFVDMENKRKVKSSASENL